VKYITSQLQWCNDHSLSAAAAAADNDDDDDDDADDLLVINVIVSIPNAGI